MSDDAENADAEAEHTDQQDADRRHDGSED